MMFDQSDSEDGLPSDVVGIPVEEDSDESETEQGDEFFDMEAEESDGHDADEDEDENEYYDEEDDDEDDSHPSRNSQTYSFPQFSRLPPELRALIWEAVDPDLKSKGRVLDFIIVRTPQPDLWESAVLEQQTAPARTLLAVNQESRSIALKHYPDVVRLRRGLGQVRFKSASDIILLRHFKVTDDVLCLKRWCDNIKYLAVDVISAQRSESPEPHALPVPDDPSQDFGALEAVFYCFEGSIIGRRKLSWAVSEASRQFYIQTFEESPGLGEDFKVQYCWPDPTPDGSFADLVGETYMLGFPEMPAIGSIPIWPMAQFSFDGGLSLFRKAKRYYEWNKDPESGARLLLESSENEPFYESAGSSEPDDYEPDDYELDGFVVDNFPFSGSEGPSDDEEDGVDIHGSQGSSAHGHLSDGDERGYEGGARFDQGPTDFNGFSPLQGSSDDEVTEGMPNATSVTYDPESPDGHVSDAPSLEEQPHAGRHTGRRKRRIVSSDDEEDGEDGGVSGIGSHSRIKKRARVVLSDSEDDEGSGANGVESGAERSSRPKKRAHVILSDSEEDDEEPPRSSEHGIAGEGEDEGESDEDEEGEEETEEEEEEEARASKPMSFMQKLYQFRSEVPVSPEDEPSNSAEEDDEEDQDEYDEEQQFPEAEFPDSAEEDDEVDRW
ncbi:hypothetical protein GGS24DRAFT_454625 [Hypoxylon argillaceum]|nr:hypothetical protein GGS24DRAFT_454625 [Hypoxylon argillaceum]